MKNMAGITQCARANWLVLALLFAGIADVGKRTIVCVVACLVFGLHPMFADAAGAGSSPVAGAAAR